MVRGKTMEKYRVERCRYDSTSKQLEIDAVRPMTEEEARDTPPIEGRLCVDKVDGKPHFYIEWVPAKENPPRMGWRFQAGLDEIPTDVLVQELSTRDGVERHEAHPKEPFTLDMTGPAIVLVVVG